ncbi:hypothetical protein BDN70DRAFT_812232 [Pholiota conissans]|uniref:Uncharacterized protein n=1 Tax=Pholiota conissans TaxID=109636 RepID=A0A9P6CXE0_9AGAR|nr:hypothetical protein BDN70DRAFT_812232 [Pholiota conissans]
MTEVTLQHVLSDLRPNILPKLKAEADVFGSSPQKTATVDTHRGETYQFCYFIRKTEPHSVLIKVRKIKRIILPYIKQKKRKEMMGKSSIATRNKKRRVAEQAYSTDINTEDVEMANTLGDLGKGDEEYRPPAVTEDIDCGEQPVDTLDLEIVEEEKPKPVLGLTYQGFNIYGQCLCIVIEPWPTARAMPFPLSLGTPGLTKQTTLEASTPAKVPLFLPEEPDNVEGQRSMHIDQAYLDKVLNTIEVSDDEGDMGGMMEFSRVLHNVGDSRAGAINDDDDMDESVLFGDADKFKEL